jgi:hypothetical protein
MSEVSLVQHMTSGSEESGCARPPKSDKRGNANGHILSIPQLASSCAYLRCVVRGQPDVVAISVWVAPRSRGLRAGRTGSRSSASATGGGRGLGRCRRSRQTLRVPRVGVHASCTRNTLYKISEYALYSRLCITHSSGTGPSLSTWGDGISLARYGIHQG